MTTDITKDTARKRAPTKPQIEAQKSCAFPEHDEGVGTEQYLKREA
ncbi:MAG TPA: hypothetical protein VNA16_02975 [Abditibacteriaceae bacterium]|nr:hypothetical protein [Abditibacteriaceae bacterium]